MSPFNSPINGRRRKEKGGTHQRQVAFDGPKPSICDAHECEQDEGHVLQHVRILGGRFVCTIYAQEVGDDELTVRGVSG
jgi:hypothetical protein